MTLRYTNLNPYSSGEAVTPGTSIFRYNLATDPRATGSAGTPPAASTGLGFYRRWYGTGTGTTDNITGATDGPLPSITTYQRSTFLTSPTSTAELGFNHSSGASSNTGLTSAVDYVVSPGQVLTVSSYLRMSGTATLAMAVRFYFRDAAGVFISSSGGTRTTLVSGQWARISHTMTVPAGAGRAGITTFADGNSNVPLPGDTIDATGLLVEQSDQLRYFFDGATPDAQGWDYAWVGSANASASSAKCTVVEMRRNYAVDPLATTYTVANGTLGWKNTRWAGSAPAAATYTLVTGASDGPALQIRNYARKTWTVGTTNMGGSGDTGFEHSGGGTTGFPVVAGEVYTFSSYMRASVARNVYMRVQYYTAAGAASSTIRTDGPLVFAGPNTWVRVSVTVTIPADTAFVLPLSDSSASTANGAVVWPVGGTLDGTAMLVEKLGGLLPYFDGSSYNYDDFVTAWTGSGNASQSVANAARIVPFAAQYGSKSAVSFIPVGSGNTAFRQMSTVPVAGTESMYFMAGGFGTLTPMAAGKTYTALALVRVLAPTSNVSNRARTLALRSDGPGGSSTFSAQAPNVPGVYELRVTATIPDTATGAILQVNHYGVAGDPDLVWDQIAIVEGEYTGPYFDGATADTPFVDYAWLGTPYSSASTQSGLDMDTQTLPEPYGLALANNSKGRMRVIYRSGWLG